MTAKPPKWGFIRETSEKAKLAGVDRDTGLYRTGLDEYLKVIFPNTEDWIHDKSLGIIDGKSYRTRPDYRSESLRLIVEFDGLQHYTKPDRIESDAKTTGIYNDLGYTVVRIPYFIQLTNRAVSTLFHVEVAEDLFDGSIPSLGIQGQNTPAYLCPAGLRRMAAEFRRFPEQYVVNAAFLKSQNDPYKTGVDFLEQEYGRIE
jgi:hypothetical protein